METKNTQSSRDVKPLFSVWGDKMSRQITLLGKSVATPREEHEIDKQIENLAKVFMKPIIGFGNGYCPWGDTIPEWLKNRDPLKRMEVRCSIRRDR